MKLYCSRLSSEIFKTVSCFIKRRMGSECTCRVAVCQMTSTADVQANLEVCRDLIERAATAKAAMVFLPEGCDYIAPSQAETLAMAHSPEGPVLSQFRALAKEHGVWLALGGIHFKSSLEGKVSNSSVVINAEGDVIARYDKTHLFDVDIPERRLRLMESGYVERGHQIGPTVDTPAGILGQAICYDMRFPELALTLRAKGAEVLAFPSAFTSETGSVHWEALLRARALDTQCYVLASAQTGQHNAKRRSWGHAMAVDPWGAVIAQCGEGVGLVTAEINLNYLREVRRNLPLRQHRRNDLYPAMPEVATSQPTYQFGQVSVTRECVFVESGLSIAFTNKRCMVPGHVLVAPVRPALRLADLTPAEMADVFQVVQRVQTAMEEITGAKSSTICVQDGPEAGRTIQHVHVHIMPRKAGDFARNDDIYTELERHDRDEEKPWRTEEEMAAEAELIRKHLKQYQR